MLTSPDEEDINKSPLRKPYDAIVISRCGSQRHEGRVLFCALVQLFFLERAGIPRLELTLSARARERGASPRRSHSKLAARGVLA
jgi:hypothetical protein